MISPEGTQTHTQAHTHAHEHTLKHTSPLRSQGITLHSLPDFRQVLLLFVGAFGSTVLDCSISVHLYQLDTSDYVFLVVCCRPNLQGLTVPVQGFSIWMGSLRMFYTFNPKEWLFAYGYLNCIQYLCVHLHIVLDSCECAYSMCGPLCGNATAPRCERKLCFREVSRNEAGISISRPCCCLEIWCHT